MNTWNQIADDETIARVVLALKNNGMDAFVVENSIEAKKKVFEMIPEGAEVMTMSSVTLDTTGIAHEVQTSGKYDSIKEKLAGMDRETEHMQMQKLGAAHEWAIGSVHALTEDGHALIASNTGSQLPAYSYGASHVVWVVGAQKVVKNTQEGINRIYEYVLPLESARLKKVYGVESNVSKLLIVNAEKIAGRITVILVKEVLGY